MNDRVPAARHRFGCCGRQLAVPRSLAGLRGEARWPGFFAKIGLDAEERSANANKPLSEQGNAPAKLSSAGPQA
jgi:hypothetical protein